MSKQLFYKNKKFQTFKTELLAASSKYTTQIKNYLFKKDRLLYLIDMDIKQQHVWGSNKQQQWLLKMW